MAKKKKDESTKIYPDKKKQNQYDDLRKQGKTDTQARQIISMTHK